ncbi:hypothetical protein O3Q51_08655 [Cryomorphaceae bacterium 1068]|nr:hypothetical protein [Cryomorphaceae bacterium 1068]
MQIAFWIILAVLVGFAGTNRKGGFWLAFFLGLVLSPLVGLIVVMTLAKKNAKGCAHCGNEYNEAEYCGLCKKNDQGLTREEAAMRK